MNNLPKSKLLVALSGLAILLVIALIVFYANNSTKKTISPPPSKEAIVKVPSKPIMFLQSTCDTSSVRTLTFSRPESQTSPATVEYDQSLGFENPTRIDFPSGKSSIQQKLSKNSNSITIYARVGYTNNQSTTWSETLKLGVGTC